MADNKDIASTECMECKADIPSGASICSACQSFQSKWKNNLKFFANIAGIVSLIGALIVYFISNYSEIRKNISWKDEISVISFVSYDHIAISNIGDGPVYLSHVNFESDLETGNFSNIIHLGLTLNPNEVSKIDLPPQFKQSELKSHYVTVGGVDNDKWSKILAKAISGKNTCYIYNVFFSEDPGLVNMQKSYSKDSKNSLRVFKAKSSITFYSLKNSKKLIYSFPVLGTVAIDNTSTGCEDNK